MSINFDTPDNADDQPEWLTDPDDDGDGEGGNRIFVIAAVALAGLILLGLIAVGGLLFIRRTQDQQTLAQLTPSPAPVIVEEVVPTPTFTPTPLPPTSTPVPTITPTNTPVVRDDDQAGVAPGDGGDSGGTGGDAGGGAAAPTNTPVIVATPAGTTEVPNTGFGGFEAILVGLALVAVVFISRRLRHAT